MSKSGRLSSLVAAVIIALFGVIAEATALDLVGAWATEAGLCSKIFARKGRAKQTDFTNFSDAHGGGFIVQRDRLLTKFDSCSIKFRKEEALNINLVVSCAKGMMLSNVQFFAKIIDNNTITRQFPGLDGMDMNYYRCTI